MSPGPDVKTTFLASQDEALSAQLESLRDTGSVVRVSGSLMVGVPDVNGTRIEVSKIEVLTVGSETQPELSDSIDLTETWPVFTSTRFGYQIKYPQDAKISLFGPMSFAIDEIPAGMSDDQYLDELQKLYTDQLCVNIEYSLGWIYISAPPNQEKHYTPCGPTGIGSGEVINTIEIVVIGETIYQAHGMEVLLQVSDGAGGIITGDTLNLHYEDFRLVLEDGTVIRYGAKPNAVATYQDYLMKTKEMLLQIIATYQAVK